MSPVYMHTQIETAEGTVTFCWPAGGAYIDVTFPGATHPSEVINVWDYHHGKALIWTAESFYRECIDFLDRLMENNGEEFMAYIENARW
jgi:hypothetical protein